jgi:pyrroline-5-carboxylate reductase
MENKKIAIIGIGNMGGAIVNGLIKSGFVTSTDIFVSDKERSILARYKDLGVNIADNNRNAAQNAGIVIVAVKPYHLEHVINEIKPVLDTKKILISIAAGVKLEELSTMCGSKVPVFRVMPNTAVSLRESFTCISAGENADLHKKYVIELFDQLGKTLEIPEEMMAAATALSSCGIAYALRFIRAAMVAGIEIGFKSEIAQYITAQTVKGAAELILQSANHPESEIDKVTTPGGITITGLNEMENKGFSSSLIQGVLASYRKIK